MVPDDYIPRMHALISREGQIKAQAKRKRGGGHVCYVCGQQGHFARDCSLGTNVNDDEFSAYRDASAEPVVSYGDDDDDVVEAAKVASLFHHLSKVDLPSTAAVQSRSAAPDAEMNELSRRLEALKVDSVPQDKPPLPASSPPSGKEVAPPLPLSNAPVSVRDLKKKHGVLLRRVKRVAEFDVSEAPVVGSNVKPPPMPRPPSKSAPPANPLAEALKSVTRESDEEVEVSSAPVTAEAVGPAELVVMARKVTTIARRVTKTDLPDESDMAAQSTMIHVQPFKDIEPLAPALKWAVFVWAVIATMMVFGSHLIANDCEFWRPSPCPSYSLTSMLTGDYWQPGLMCSGVAFAPLDFGIFNERISNMRPFAWITGSTYTQWQECQSDHILPLEIRWALKNFSARELVICMLLIAWVLVARRTTWYTPLEYTRLRSAYDVRNLANMARPVVFADPQYRRFRVTEISGNVFLDIWNLVTGQATREVIVSMELFASLQSCRQQLLSMKGKKSADLVTGLGRNAELQDQLNIDRYIDALHGVHLQTVYLAYHHLMSEERHKEAVF